MCRDIAFSVMTGKAQILRRWVQHFDNLLNRNISTQQTTEEDVEGNENFRPKKMKLRKLLRN
jgi:hypothetical protein